MVTYVGNKTIIGCPGLPKPFVRGGYLLTIGSLTYGYVIGFNYHGGRNFANWNMDTNLFWQSPQKLSEPGNLVLLSDLNVWSPDYQSVAPHGPRGAVQTGEDASNDGLKGKTPRELGAAGGNVGTLDGAVGWKSLDAMKTYQISDLMGQAFGNW